MKLNCSCNINDKKLERKKVIIKIHFPNIPLFFKLMHFEALIATYLMCHFFGSIIKQGNSCSNKPDTSI